MAPQVFHHLDIDLLSRVSIKGERSPKARVLQVGGLFLLWKGARERRYKSKGIEQGLKLAANFYHVLFVIVDLYQNWLQRKHADNPIKLHRRKEGKDGRYDVNDLVRLYPCLQAV